MKEFIGIDAIQNLRPSLDQLGAKTVALITNKSSYFHPSIETLVAQQLKDIAVVHFFDITPNPTVENLLQALSFLQKASVDVVIGVGGGSALDMAKLCAVYWDKKIDFTDPNLTREKPLILIPTTAGSGSETTKFAVIYENGNKVSVDHPALLADEIFLDPKLTVNLPKYVTAYTAADALCQAIESYWARAATPESKNWAINAIKLVLENAKAAIANPSDLNARLQLLIGASLAGKAINVTRTTAPHALSYYLTQTYGIPHGHAVALTLPYVLEANATECDLKIIFELFQVNNAAEAKNYLLKFFTDLGLETSFANLNILVTDAIAQSVNLERLQNNPKVFTIEELKELVAKIS